MKHLFSGLRLRLLLVTALVCVPLVCLMVHTAWQERHRQLANWAQDSEDMMQLAAQEEEKVIGQTRQLLLAMAASSQVLSGDPRDCEKLLDAVLVSYPRYANLEVIDADGNVLASAVPLTNHFNPQNPLFNRVLAKRAFSVGDFPIGQTNGAVTVDFGCPVFGHAGKLQSVMIASLTLDWFSHYESEIMLKQLPKLASWTEIDSKGRILVRYPSPEKWIGHRLPEKSLLKMVFDRDRGVVESDGIDNAPGYYAFVATHSHFVPGKVITILGIPKQILFAGPDEILLRDLIGLAIAASVAFFLGWLGSNLLILRPVRALVKSSARLGAGDLTARSGVPSRGDELGQLTRTFDSMAQAIQHREMERQRTNKKLQTLSRRLVEVQETERRHLARELHDEIGQTLTVAELNLQAALQSRSVGAQAPRLKQTLDAVERVLEQVRDISLNLRPSMLDDLGLEPALLWLTNRQAELSKLRPELRIDLPEDRLDPAIETECYRVAQEALTNVARHAKARKVNLTLSRADGLVHLRVRDDGVGFDVAAVREQAVRGTSLGLLSMEERAALVGGGLEYKSAPGKGTEIHAWFPMKWAARPNN